MRETKLMNNNPDQFNPAEPTPSVLSFKQDTAINSQKLDAVQAPEQKAVPEVNLRDREAKFIIPVTERIINNHENLVYTGLSGSGKSEAWRKIQRLIYEAGLPIIILNGQVVGADEERLNEELSFYIKDIADKEITPQDLATIDQIIDIIGDKRVVFFIEDSASLVRVDNPLREKIKSLADRGIQVILESPFRPHILPLMNEVAGVENPDQDDIFVPTFSQDDTAIVLQHNTEREFSQDQINQFYQLTGGHPWLVDHLSLNLANYNYDISVLQKRVAQALQIKNFSGDMSFVNTIFEEAGWTVLDDDNKEILAAVAQAGKIDLDDLTGRFRYRSRQEIEERVKLLENLNLIKNNNINGGFYRQYILLKDQGTLPWNEPPPQTLMPEALQEKYRQELLEKDNLIRITFTAEQRAQGEEAIKRLLAEYYHSMPMPCQEKENQTIKDILAGKLSVSEVNDQYRFPGGGVNFNSESIRKANVFDYAIASNGQGRLVICPH